MDPTMIFQPKRTVKLKSAEQRRSSRQTSVCLYLLVVSLTWDSIDSEPVRWNAMTLFTESSFFESIMDERSLSMMEIWPLDINRSFSSLSRGFSNATVGVSCLRAVSDNIISKLRAGGGESTAYSMTEKIYHDTMPMEDDYISSASSSSPTNGYNNITQPNALHDVFREHSTLSNKLPLPFGRRFNSPHNIEHSHNSVVTVVKRDSRQYDLSSEHPIYLASSMDDSDYSDSKQETDKNQDLNHVYMPNMYHDFSIHPLDPAMSDLPPIFKQDLAVESDPTVLNPPAETIYTPSEPMHHGEEAYSRSTRVTSASSEDEKYPVIYRYFGRSRTRSVRYESTPYIILCPNVDHFKVVGQILSSRGFNTMVCQRVINDRIKHEDTFDIGNSRKSLWDMLPWNRQSKPAKADSIKYTPTDGTKLVLAILDVLKWKKAVLVGCGAEAILAIEAALHLAPDRVAGLIVCGDLTSAHEHASEFLEESTTKMSDESSHKSFIPSFAAPFHERERSLYRPWSLDTLLQDYIHCPATIIWDGDSTALMSSKIRGDKNSIDGPMKSFIEQLEARRCVIIGGSSAPYRKLPEQFSWACTRFVEKELPTSSDPCNGMNEEDSDDSITDEYDVHDYDEADTDLESSTYPNAPSFWSHIVPGAVTRAWSNMFHPGSLVVSGRLVASVIIYLTLARVAVFHYNTAAHGLAGLRTSYLSVSTWWKQLTSLFLSFIPVLSKDVASSNVMGTVDSSENDDSNAEGDESDKVDSPKSGEESGSEDDSTVRKLFFYDQIFT